MNINPKIAVVAVCGTLSLGVLGYVGYNQLANAPQQMTAAELAADNARMKSQLEAHLPPGVARPTQAAAAAPVARPRAAGDMSGPDDPAPAPAAVLASRPPSPAPAPAPSTAPVPAAVATAVPLPGLPAATRPAVAPQAVAAGEAPSRAGVPQEKVSVLLVDIMGKMEKATGRIVSIGKSFDRIHADSTRM